MLEIKHFQYLWCPTKRVWKWLQNGLKFIFNTTLDSDKCLDSISLRLSIWSCFNLNTNIPYLSTRAIYCLSTLHIVLNIQSRQKMKILLLLLQVILSQCYEECIFFEGAMCPLLDDNIVDFDHDVSGVAACQTQWASAPQHFPIRRIYLSRLTEVGLARHALLFQ